MLNGLIDSRLRYDVLNSELKPVLTKNPLAPLNVNIIYDLKMVFRKCLEMDFSFDSETIQRTDDEIALDLIAEILNTIGYYRTYINKILKKESKVYIIYNDKVDDVTLTNFPEYRADYYSRVTNSRSGNIYKIVIELITAMFNVIPNLFIINNDNELLASGIIVELIKERAPNEYIFAITNDVNLNQTGIDGCLMLKGKNSCYVSKDATIDYLTEQQNTIGKNIEVLPLLLSIAGYSKYNYAGVKGVKYKKAIKGIASILSTNPELSTTLLDVDKLKPFVDMYNDDNIVNAYKCLCYEYLKMQYNIYDSQKDYYRTILNSNKIVDINGLRELNDNYFVNNPVILENLIY